MFHVKHSVSNIPLSVEKIKEVSALQKKHQSKLNLYAELLLWWNKKINLVSREVSRETVLEHIYHSLLISSTDIFVDSKIVVDTGTGGGLPGIPLAICYPEKHFILNDIVAKKIMAVKQMGVKLGLKNVSTHSASIQKIELGSSEAVITKHAFKIYELIELLDGKDWNRLVFLKGEKEALEEIKAIEESLLVNISTLEGQLKSDFYKGKAIVEISRSNHE